MANMADLRRNNMVKLKICGVAAALCALLSLCGCNSNKTNQHVHDFSTEVISPTCSKEGYTIYTCKTCHFKAHGDFVPALESGGHNYVDCICMECNDFLIDEAEDTVSLKYEKTTDENGSEVYAVTGMTADCGYIKIPSTYNGLPVTKIADEAFLNVLPLKHVIIPESIVSVGNAAFRFCFNLISVTILGDGLSLGSEAFWDCRNLKDITFGSVVEINEYAFFGCQSIENIVLSDKITEIAVHAFGDCYGLKSITIPAGVANIRRAAFWNDYNLTDIFYEGATGQWRDVNKEIGVYTNTNQDASWDAYTGDYTVHCIDGDIEKTKTDR